MPVIDPVSSDSDFPKKTTVAVIGGGVIGVATALELAERGVPVVLLEKGIIAGEQSSRNWGWCRQMGRDSREIPLILESLKLWRGMNERVGAETGYRQCGVIYLAENEVELAAREKWYAENAKAFGLDTKLVSGAEAERLQPGSTRTWKGALYTSADGRAEPFIAVPAMARQAQKLGREDIPELRGARGGNSRWQNHVGGDGKGNHRLRAGGAGGRGLVAALPA